LIGVGDTKKFKWQINLPVLHDHQHEITDFPFVPEGVTFNGPCLFIGATESHRMHADYHPAVRRRFPNAQISMQKGGHFVYPSLFFSKSLQHSHAENPVVVTQVIVDFFDKNRALS
jgi:hypothetical protein